METINDKTGYETDIENRCLDYSGNGNQEYGNGRRFRTHLQWCAKRRDNQMWSPPYPPRK
ncbi:hypothetical protein HHI36_003435, partial [Cryptolaemus montrouzieri]